MNFQELISTQPYIAQLAIKYVEDSNGGNIFYLEPEERFIGNPMLNAIHGGIICGLLESASSLTLMLARETNSPPRLISQTTSFLGSASADKTLFVRTEITKSGKRILAVNARAYQDDADKLVAKASILFRP